MVDMDGFVCGVPVDVHACKGSCLLSAFRFDVHLYLVRSTSVGT